MSNHEDEFDVEGFGDAEIAEVLAAESTDQPAASQPNQPAEATEAPASAATSTPVSPEEQAKADAEAKAKADAEKAARKQAEEAALTEFKSVAERVVSSEDVDTSTGVPSEALKSEVTGAYSKLGTAAPKKQAKAWLQERMQACMLEGPNSFTKARTYLELFQAVEAIKAQREQVVRTPVDPTEEHVKRVTAAYLAPNLMLPGDEVAADWQDRVQKLAAELQSEVVALRNWLVEHGSKADDDETKPDQPEVNAVVQTALRLAQGRPVGGARKSKAKSNGSGTTTTRTPFTGERGDIAQHITEAFANVQSGEFLSISDMVNFTSSQYGGDKKAPSPGAIAARLFPRGGGECTVEGITPTDDPKKGAIKN